MANVKNVLGKALQSAKRMTFAQVAIEKMQLAIASGAIALDKAVERGRKLIVDAQKREKDARNLKVGLASTYKEAADYYANNLAIMNAEELETEHYEKQVKNIKAFLTDEQLEIVKEFAKAKTAVTIAEINSIREFLVHKGQKVDAVKPPKATRPVRPQNARQFANAE